MKARISSIAREAHCSYRVAIENINGESRSFLFEVQNGEIDLVTYQDDFVLYMSYNLGPAAPLFEAVLKFHYAQNLELPIAENR
jgi:hypothetical protein